MNLKKWKCEILVDAEVLPLGFDAPPRNAAISAIERSGATVIACSSGWGEPITDQDKIFYVKAMLDVLWDEIGHDVMMQACSQKMSYERDMNR